MLGKTIQIGYDLILMQQANSTKKSFHSIYPWIVWGLGAAYFFLEYLARVSPSVMVQDLMKAYQVNALSLGSLSAFFYYAYVFMQIPVGTLVDRYGPHRLLTVMCGLCGASCLLFAHAPNLYFADLSRFVMGFAAAFAFVGTLKIAADWFDISRFGFLSGTTQALGMLGAAFGIGPLSWLVQHAGWRYAIDIIGITLLLLTTLIGVIVRDKSVDKTISHDPATKKLSTFKTLKIVFKNPQIWLVSTMSGFLYAPTGAFAELWGVSYVTKVHHLSLSVAASAVSLIFIGWAIGGPFFGAISDKIQNRKLILRSSIIGSFVFMSIVLYFPDISAAGLFVLLFLYGFSNTGVATTYAMAREINPDEVSGTSMSFTNMASVIIGAGFQPLIGWALDSSWSGEMSHGIRVYSTHDYQVALAMLPLCFVVCFIVSFFVKESHPHAKNKRG